MKYRYKLMLTMLGLISLVFGIGGAVIISVSFNQMLEEEIELDMNRYEILHSTISTFSEAGSVNTQRGINKTIRNYYEKSTDIQAIRVVGEESTCFGDTDARFVEMNDVADSTTIAYKIIGDNSYKALFKKNGTYRLQISGAFMAYDDEMRIDVLYDISDLYHVRYKYLNNYLIIYAAIMLVSVMLSYFLSYMLTRPLGKLTNTSKRIAAGQYDCRSNIKSNDEIGELSKQFNIMTDALIDQVERQNTFVANFTHEMKTPMTSIIGYSDLLRQGGLDLEDAREAAVYIFKEGKRLERLSQKMLELMVVKNNNQKLVPASPGAIIRGIVLHLRGEYASQGIGLGYKCEKGKCLLEPDYFASLIRNLLENARRATPGGGRIAIMQRMTDEGCHIVIRDTGCGMPKEALDKITDAFYRVDKARSRSYGGAGLGLALCKQIVEMHNGEIRFESKVDVGTVVYIDIRGGLVNEDKKNA